MSSTALNEFLLVLKNFIEFIGENLDIDKEIVIKQKNKLDTLSKHAPQVVYTEVMTRLGPHKMAIYKRDEKLILDNYKDLPILKHVNVPTVWPKIPQKLRDEVWSRLASLLVLSTAVEEETGQLPKGTILPNNSNVNMEQLGAEITNSMPMILNMLGPLLSGIGGGGLPDQQQRSNTTRERLRKKVDKKNQLKNLY